MIELAARRRGRCGRTGDPSHDKEAVLPKYRRKAVIDKRFEYLMG
jgi:hypothetical protein